MEELFNIIVGDLEVSPDLIVVMRFVLIITVVYLLVSIAKNILKLGDL